MKCFIISVRSHWGTYIAINVATTFATKNVMGLIPIFVTKYLQLSNLQMYIQSYPFNCISNTFHFPCLCSTKLLTLMIWVWYTIEWVTLHLRLWVTRRRKHDVTRPILMDPNRIKQSSANQIIESSIAKLKSLYLLFNHYWKHQPCF